MAEKKTENEIRDEFLDGNELIEESIEKFRKDSSPENMIIVLNAIRTRMHADGHFLFPVFQNEEDPTQFGFHTIAANDGKTWCAVFTSKEEYEKGASSQILSYFIDAGLKMILDSETEGVLLNPWGTPFFMSKPLIQKMFEMDGGVEYTVPDDPITEELLEGGEFLKRAISICNRNHTSLNHIKLIKILRHSYIWVPCNAVMGEQDAKHFEALIKKAMENDDFDSLVGEEYVSQEETRMIPDILQSGDDFFFPVFSSIDEMGEYGDHFSKVEMPFLRAINLARNNEKQVKGIVINAFSEPFEIPTEIFEIIGNMDSDSKDNAGMN